MLAASFLWVQQKRLQMLPDEWQVAIEIVIGIYLDQLDLAVMLGRVVSAIVRRNGSISAAMDDEGGGGRGDGLQEVEAVGVKIIPERQVFVKGVVEHLCGTGCFPLGQL
jgi:hypothetical protein